MSILCIEFKPIIEITPFLTTILSVVVVIIGWGSNQAKNRKNEIAKEARGYRIEMLRSFMSLVSEIEEKNTLNGIQEPNELGDQDNKIPPMALWAKIHIQIKMYGKNDEIKLYNEIMSTLYSILTDGEPCFTDKQFSTLSEKVKNLELLFIDSIRKELNLKY